MTRAPESIPNKALADGIGRVQLTSTNMQMNPNVRTDVNDRFILIAYARIVK